MEDVVSENIEEQEEQEEQVAEKEEVVLQRQTSDLLYEIEIQYRLIRKNLSAFFRNSIKKNLTNILYISDGNYSNDYILAMQKQHPDKLITILVPDFGTQKNLNKSVATLEYNLQNKRHIAKLYKYPTTQNNIQIYGISSRTFSDLEKPSDLYNIHNLSHYSASARIAAKKLKPDIIHSENIPFLLGCEFNKKSNNTVNLLQTIHDFSVYSDIEPFWAVINIFDKKEMNRLCRDKIIKKNLAALFGIKNINNFSKWKQCLEYLYNNYEQYRKTYTKEDSTNENILIGRLNKRVIELYPQAFYKEMFNPIYYSAKNSKEFAVNSKPEKYPEWMDNIPNCNILIPGANKDDKIKLAHPFDINNFRYYREYNKQYLIKEFAEKQIKTNFTDLNLFSDNEVNISGFLDSFYKGTLLLAVFNNFVTEDYIKTVANSVLKCFEYKKNIQVIFNAPSNFESQYLQSFVDFLEKQPSLIGKWVFVQGGINLPQFTASSDIILLPDSNIIGVENILYTALQYGCIPVTENSGICSDIVIDIFDDMISGFGFKTSDNSSVQDLDKFTNALFKGMSFRLQNFTSWNLLIKNAISYDSSWNFELIEKYNNLYDKIV